MGVSVILLLLIGMIGGVWGMPEMDERAENYIQHSLAYHNFTEWRDIVNAADKHSDCLLCSILAADYYFHFSDSNSYLYYLARAKKIKKEGMNDREEAYLKGYVAWLQDWKLQDAFDHFSRHASATNDLFAMKRAQLIGFLMGDFQKMVDIAEHVRDSGHPYYHGMLAFALDQVGREEEAKEAALRGIMIDVKDGWAHHALAHSLLHSPQLSTAVSTLEPLSTHWSVCNDFLQTHNWWHVAILHLALGDVGRVVEIYDQHMYGPRVNRTYVEAVLNAAELLWKLEVHPSSSSSSSSSSAAASNNDCSIYGNENGNDSNESDEQNSSGGICTGLHKRWMEVANHVVQGRRQPGYLLYDVLAWKALYTGGNHEQANALEKKLIDIAGTHAWGKLFKFLVTAERLSVVEEGGGGGGGDKSTSSTSTSTTSPTSCQAETINELCTLSAFKDLTAGLDARTEIIGGSGEQLWIFPEVALRRAVDLCGCGPEGYTTSELANNILSSFPDSFAYPWSEWLESKLAQC